MLLAFFLIFTGFAIPDFSYGLETNFMQNLQIGANVQALYELSANQDDEKNTYTVLIPIENENKAGIFVKLKDDFKDTNQTYNFLKTDESPMTIVRYDNTSETIVDGCSSEQLKSGIYLKDFSIGKNGNGYTFKIRAEKTTYTIKLKRYLEPTINIGFDNKAMTKAVIGADGSIACDMKEAAKTIQIKASGMSMLYKYVNLNVNGVSATLNKAQSFELSDIDFVDGIAKIPVTVTPNEKQTDIDSLIETDYEIRLSLNFDDISFSNDASAEQEYKLTPDFSKDTKEYTLLVPNAESKIFVRSVCANIKSQTVKYNNQSVDVRNDYKYHEINDCISSGDIGGDLNITAGEESYHIKIVRNPALKNLEVKTGNKTLKLDSDFLNTKEIYYAFVPENALTIMITGAYENGTFCVNDKETTDGSADYTIDWGENTQIEVPLKLEHDGRRTVYKLVLLKGDSDNPVIVSTENFEETTYTKTQFKQKNTKELHFEAVVPQGGKLSYQWERLYCDVASAQYGVVRDANGNTLKIGGESALGNWKYRCKVTNTVDGKQYVTYTPECKLFIDAEAAEVPTFRYHFEDQKVMKNGNAETLDATVSYDDGGSATYQWYVNDENEGGTAIENADQPTFTPGTENVGTKYYYCEVIHTVQKYTSTVKTRAIKVEVLDAKALANDKGLTGDGTSQAPFEVYEETHLQAIRELVAEGCSFDSCYFELKKDIILSDMWKPIGQIKGYDSSFDFNDQVGNQYTYTAKGKNLLPFSGVFNGGNKTVTIPEDGLPLFGICRNARIKNLNIFGKKIASNGLLHNYVVDYGTDGQYETGCPVTATIENVTLKSDSQTLRSGFLSGFASGANTVNIINCEIEPNVTIGYLKDQSKIGSFGGQFNGNITNSKSAADVYGVNAVGGLIGCKGQSMGDCIVKTSAFTGNVIATGSRVGGIIGSGYDALSAPNTPVVTVRNSYVNANIQGGDEVGGILGSEPVCEDCWANGEGSIIDNVFYGKISASEKGAYLGGIIGFMKSYNENQTMTNNFYVDTCNAVQGVGKVEISKVSNLELKNCGTAASEKEMADGTVVKRLNDSKTSFHNWVQGKFHPVHSEKAVAYEIVLSGDYKTSYYIGDSFSSKGLVITANYSDGSSKAVENDKANFTGFSSDSVGYKTITVEYEGLKATYDIKVLYKAPQAITASITIYGDDQHDEQTCHTLKKGGLKVWVEKTFISINQNTTVKDMLETIARRNGIELDTNPNSQFGYYVAGMTKDGKYLAEFTNGSLSGWMYTVNGTHPQLSAGYYFVKEGDDIIWHYTDDYTKEEGSEKWNSGTKTEETKNVTTDTKSGTVTTPTETKVTEKTNADGTKEKTVAVTVSADNQTEIIKQAADKKSAEIVLEVASTATNGAQNIQLQLNVSFVKNVSEKTDAALTVNTENGTVSLDQDTIKTVLDEAKGATITLDVNKVANPTEVQKKAAGESGQILSLTVKSGDKTISDFKTGKVTVTVAISTALQGKRVAAIHIAEDGKIEQMPGKSREVGGKKCYEFTTSHFSDFALVDADELGLETEEEIDAAALVAKLTPVARSAKTAKGYIKVTTNLDKQDKAIISELADAGYTVKYRFYRSTKKAASYKSAITKKTTSYTNTTGKKGTKYFYKVQVRVYDASGKLVAKTALKQCRYASRVWTK